MKPYFTEYLPVVGKIKAGDTVRDINTGFTAQLAEDADEYAELLNEHDYNKKVKLFLCSQDIQVGDIFNFIASDGRLLERKFFKDLSDHPDKINWFKIIGEISPDATWVKEGDEFDEEDVIVFFNSPNFTLVKREYTLKQAKNFYGNSPHNADITIKLKGPCGHFH